MKNYIYILKDPISNEVRYVGKSNNPQNRLKRHLSESNLIESWTPKNKWLLSLRKDNLSPIMEIIDSTDLDDINELEVYWIKHYHDLGVRLTNGTDGGDGFDWTGRKHSNKSIERLRLCHPSRKEIIQFELDNKIVKIYNSIHECENITVLSRSHIIKCCKDIKSYMTVGGFYFRYIDNYFPCVKSILEPDMDYINSKIGKFNLSKPTYITKKEQLRNKLKESNVSKRKSIIHYDLEGNILGKYKSMSEARDFTGCHIGLISNCCNKKSYYTVNNTTFRYDGDIFDYKPYNVCIQVNSKKVCKYDLDGKLIEVYDSIKQAMRNNNITSDSNIVSCCKRKINKKTGKFIKVKGFTYRYFEETEGKDLI